MSTNKNKWGWPGERWTPIFAVMAFFLGVIALGAVVRSSGQEIHNDTGAATHRCEIAGRAHACTPYSSRAEDWWSSGQVTDCRCVQPGNVRVYYTVEWQDGRPVERAEAQ